MKRGLIALGLWSVLAGTAGAVGNLTDVTIYDRTENRVLPAYYHGGRYYVVGSPGNEYQVRIRNRGATDVLAVVSVDGINAVSGETANWSQTGYVLGANQGYDVKGWRKSLQRIAAFFFTEHQNAYATRTGRPDNVGVIGVAVFRRKYEPEARIDQPVVPLPRREAPAAGAANESQFARQAEAPASTAAAASGAPADRADRYAPAAPFGEKRSSLGTGHGRSESSRVTYTDFERATPAPEEVIAIHYDTYSNLVALGVIRAPRFATPAPFPGQFVPDPR